MKLLQKIFAILLVICTLTGCTPQPAPQDEISFSTENMELVTKANNDWWAIQEQMCRAVILLGNDWQFTADKVDFSGPSSGLGFGDMILQSHRVQYDKSMAQYINGEYRMYLDDVKEQSLKYFPFTEQALEEYYTSQTVYDKATDSVPAPDGYGNLCEINIVDIYNSENEYIVQYLLIMPEGSYSEGRALLEKNSKGDFIFMAGQRDEEEKKAVVQPTEFKEITDWHAAAQALSEHLVNRSLWLYEAPKSQASWIEAWRCVLSLFAFDRGQKLENPAHPYVNFVKQNGNLHRVSLVDAQKMVKHIFGTDGWFLNYDYDPVTGMYTVPDGVGMGNSVYVAESTVFTDTANPDRYIVKVTAKSLYEDPEPDYYILIFDKTTENGESFLRFVSIE